MRTGPALALAAALASWQPTAECVPSCAAPAAARRQPDQLVLEVRIFKGLEDVTRHTRVTIHRAGERQTSLPHPSSHGDAGVELQVPPGIYDLQAIHERDGRVVDIRWANRLVVMPYPDERGRHLEVVNFKNGFGALQVRGEGGPPPEVAIYATARRDRPASPPVVGRSYTLFIVPAGVYDLEVRKGPRATWLNGIDVPLDRTRLSIVK